MSSFMINKLISKLTWKLRINISKVRSCFNLLRANLKTVNYPREVEALRSVLIHVETIKQRRLPMHETKRNVNFILISSQEISN